MDKNKIRIVLYSYAKESGLYAPVYFTINDKGRNTDENGTNYKVREFEHEECMQLINNKIYIQHLGKFTQVAKVLSEDEWQWMMIK